MFNALSDVNFFQQVGSLMLLELLVSSFIGFSLKYIKRLIAIFSRNCKTVSPQNYSSKYFGKEFPDTFSSFLLPIEFVIVRYEDGFNDISSETFFSVLGDSTTASYSSGKFLYHGFSALDAPIYLFAVYISIALGLFLLVVPFVNNLGLPLLISGIAWMLITTLAAVFRSVPENSQPKGL